jgi:hypothetical protein
MFADVHVLLWIGDIEEFPQSSKRRKEREMVGAEGFEPTTPASQTLCATRLRYAPTQL